MGTRRGARAGIRRWWPAALAALLLSAAGCGPLHTPPGDADGDGGVDAAPGGDADAEPDADPDVVEDAETQVDADPDFEASETAWLLASTARPLGGGPVVSDIEGYSDGGLAVAGLNGTDRGVRAWLARFDATGQLVWSRTSRAVDEFDDLSIAPDGRVFIACNSWFSAIDEDGGLLWQRRVSAGTPQVRGLPDGSVILQSVLEIARYSPTEGLLWSWHVDADVGYSEGEALAVSEAGTVFVAVGPIVVAMDLDGNLLWAGRWSGEHIPDGPAPVAAAAPTEAGGVLLVGGRLISVARLDPGGRLEWLRSFGRYERPRLYDPCTPSCLLDAATDAAVSPTGEVMVVGASTNAARLLRWDEVTAAYALWLDRDGVVTGALAVANGREDESSSSYAAAALSGGGWAVGGGLGGDMWSSERAFLASFDAPRWPGGDCPHGAEARLWDSSLTATFELEEATLSPSAFEVVEGEPLVFEELDAPMERLCW